MLYIFGGLPGTGKSTLAKLLAWSVGAIWLRIDTIEQQLRNSGLSNLYDEGYRVGFGLAEENLRNGISVVADSTNPVQASRQGWINAAISSQSSYVQIEVICSEKEEHRSRVETRMTDVPELKLPSWQSVSNREYEQWDSADLVIDTAGTSPEQSLAKLLDEIQRLS